MSIRWHAWEGTRSIMTAIGGARFAAWTIVPIGYVKGGEDTEHEVISYLHAGKDRARGERTPEFPADPAYMAGWNSDATYARGIIDAVTGVPLAHPDNPAYVAGYTYQPRPTGPKSRWRNRATPRTYSGPRS